jgi:hypothetical protein
VIWVHTNNQEVTLLLGSLEQVGMTNMKQVKRT